MSAKNYSKPNYRKYLSEFFNKGFIFSSILIALAFTTILAMINEYDFLSQLTIENNKLFTIIAFTFYFALVLIYAMLSIKNDKVTNGDSVCISFIITGVFYAIYLFAGKFDFSIKNIALILVLIITGVVLTLINSVTYNHYEGEKEIITKQRSVKSYFKLVNNKFKFFKLFLTSIIISCIAYVVLELDVNYSFFSLIKETAQDNTLYLIMLALGLICIIAYSVLSTIDEKLNSLDMFLASFYISIPVIGAMLYFLGGFEVSKNLIIFGGMFACVVILTIFRIIYFSKYVRQENNSTSFCKNLFINKDTLKAVGITALIVVFSNITIKLGYLNDLIKDNELYIYIGLLPYLFICTACFLGVISFAMQLVKSISKLSSTKFEFCDKYVIYNFMFAFFCVLAEIITPLTADGKINITSLVILASYMIISLGTMLMRKHSAK